MFWRMKRMMRRLTIFLVLSMVCGCNAAHDVLQFVVMPEQRTVNHYLDPDRLPSVPIPEIAAPRTVSNSSPGARAWNLSLDEALRIALENTRAVRVLTGTAVTASGQTIYDP